MTAANEAFEADLDQVVSLGWAHVESHAYRTLLEAAQAAPPSLKAPLQLLASLYGLTRLERSMAHYLAAGVLQGAAFVTISFAYDFLPLVGCGLRPNAYCMFCSHAQCCMTDQSCFMAVMPGLVVLPPCC